MSSYLLLFFYSLFGIVYGPLVDFAVNLPGFGVVVAERDGQRDAARILGVEGENVQVRGEVASSVCSEKVTLGPSSVPVWLWRPAVPVTLSVVALLTNTARRRACCRA